MDGILESIKAMLGLSTDYDPFDSQIIMHINTAFTVLSQLGVGPKKQVVITGYDEEWADFFNQEQNIEAVKSYIYLKVRAIFDPPTTAGAMDALERQIKELEWRLNVEVDPSQQEE